MFTGIIEEVGRVDAIERFGDGARISVSGPTVTSDARLGDSIAVNGVCLTVTDTWSEGDTPIGFHADVMQVTLDYTALGAINPGDPVNLERAMSSHGRFGGHMVQGHVDGTATVLSVTPSEHWTIYRFALDNPQLSAYLAPKGSIAINGTSLTISEVCAPEDPQPWWEVSLIPTTLADTMLGTLTPGAKVNIECDVLAKYLERMLAVRSTQGDTPTPAV